MAVSGAIVVGKTALSDTGPWFHNRGAESETAVLILKCELLNSLVVAERRYWKLAFSNRSGGRPIDENPTFEELTTARVAATLPKPYGASVVSNK
jgi:hypothetical protein